MLSKVYLLVFIALLLVLSDCRCDSVENRGYNVENRRYNGRRHYVPIKHTVFSLIVCDTSTNNAYMRYWNGKYYVF
jgi:hypothetical protein